MRTRIKNALHITCEDVDLTAVSKIEFYVKQSGFFRQYSPEVVSPNEMLVEIPFEDAMKLRPNQVKLQFAFTDENGTPQATDIVSYEVADLLKEAGYDPI